MGWTNHLPPAKLPEDEPWTVTYRITPDGDVDLLGYDVDTSLREAYASEIASLRSLVRDLRVAGRDEDAEYLEEIMDRLADECDLWAA